MDSSLTLIGFHHSVYTWVVRLALDALDLKATYVEANPFADIPDPVLAEYTPFNRVPVLSHGDFTLTETVAILRYLNDLAGAELVPHHPQSAARMAQVMGIVDADVYPIMVRKVFSYGFYLPFIGRDGDPKVVAEGIAQAQPALRALNGIASEGLQLTGQPISLADLHLAPMLSYFTRVPEGAAALASFPALAAWWQMMSNRPLLQNTDPLLS